MRLLARLTATTLALLPLAGAVAADANPLLGRWTLVGDAAPPVVGFRQMLFAPDAVIFDQTRVAVAGYDVADGAVRVRTRTGGDYIFIPGDDGTICLARVEGMLPLQPMPTVRPGDRCFARQPQPGNP